MPGHVRKRGKRRDGTTKWQARWRHPSDQTVRREFTFRTRREAEDWITDMDADVRRGTYADPRKGELRVSEVADAWRETWTDLEAKTRVGYESILSRHVLPRFCSMKVADVSPMSVQRWVNELAEAHEPNTVHKVYGVLRSVMNVAVLHRYVAVSPCSAKLPKKVRGITIDPLTHEEVKQLVAALPERWRLPVLLDAYTGVRSGELWALRRRDVDLLRGELTVDEALKEVTREAAREVPAKLRLTDSLIVGPTKTHATRKVSIPPFLRPLLAEPPSGPIPSGAGPDAFVFNDGERAAGAAEPVLQAVFVPCARRVFPERTRAAEQRAIEAGKEPRHAAPFRFHDLRHTCATWLIEAGAHPLQIKLRLGHEDIKTTMNTYGHLWPSAGAAMADLLDSGYRAAAADNVVALAAVE